MAADFGSAEVKQRGADVVVIAHAMLGAGRITDWDSFSTRVPLGDSDSHLGEPLRIALLRSREMPRDWMRSRMQSNDYKARLARAFGLSSPRSLYPGMKNVLVEWADGQLVLAPTRNRRGGRFDGFELGMDQGHEHVRLPFAASDQEVGLALREALRRCL